MIDDILIYHDIESQLKSIDLESLFSFRDMINELFDRSVEQGPGGIATYGSFSFKKGNSRLDVTCDTDTDSDEYQFELVLITTHPITKKQTTMNSIASCNEFQEFLEYVIEDSIHRMCE